MQTWSSDEKTVCLSVHPSVCPSNSWFVTKRDNIVATFLYHMKDHLPQFCDKKKVGGGDTLYLQFWVKLTPLERNRRFSVNIRL